jgi:hypothetical protein
LVLCSACSSNDDPARPGGSSATGGGSGNGGGGSGAGSSGGGAIDASVPPGGGSVSLSDGGITLGDGGLPTNCALGSAGLLGLVPVATMAPGTGCGACHLAIGKPLFVSGTVYPGYHEPDLCLGVTDVQVEIVDQAGATHTLPVNSSGNFVDANATEAWPTPWTVAVTRGAARRPMVGTVTSGDCNSCHTAAGANAAPGRILAP